MKIEEQYSNTAVTVAVKIKDSCLIRGMHLEAGLTFEMSPADADDIIHAGRGVEVRSRPTRSVPEMPVMLGAA